MTDNKKFQKRVEKTVKWAEKQDGKPKAGDKTTVKDIEGEFEVEETPEFFTNVLPEMTHKTDVTAKSFDTPEANKGGRPPKYQEMFNDMAKKACSLGATDLDLAELFGVVESTINCWKLDHPGFSESIQAGKDSIDTMVEKSLLNRALGCSVKETKVFCYEGDITTKEVDKYFPPDVQAIRHWLNNRKPKVWRDKHEVDFTNPMTIVMSEADQKTL